MPARVLAREIAYLDPLAAFLTVKDLPHPVFLDSARADPRLGRWSYVAVDPFLTLSSKDGRIVLGERSFSGDPFAVLQRALAHHRLDHDPGLPVPFQTGAIGYLGYDLCHHLERLPYPAEDDLAFPDLVLGFYDAVLAFDVLDRRAWILSSGWPETTPQAVMHRQKARLDQLAARLDRAAGPVDPPEPESLVAIASNFTRSAYEAAVQRVVDYILAGDIFQANLSQRFLAELPQGLSPFDLYHRLRRRNPAPFAAFLDFGEVAIASASPERFLELRGRKVETRPIKGTRPRGSSPETDERLARELLESEKDRAENVMIVDLLRNDLSRVCADHTVLTPEICVLESFATVHHLVSTVTGELAAGLDAVDLLRATFPGGSITGAPKIRAMEIIAELEPTRRGPYCGAIGWLGFDGWMDTSITIRTYAIKGRRVAFQAGGGIVADSDPSAEYDETLAKAKALIEALRGAL
ncbi:aminodeoxychorismate synthase, component I [Geminicoccaceae bacterium SYSU G07066]|uniref:aminodeoxychorismate synthase n=2 Tax=Benzoatithermus flavus TaxID=3108223 RepID=A0ABU8XPJ5_9PROT